MPSLFVLCGKDRKQTAAIDRMIMLIVKEGGLWQTGRLLKQNT